MPNEEMPESAFAMYQADFQEQKRASIAVSMITYCEAYVLDMDQWHTAHAWSNWRILPPSNGH